MEDIDRPSRIPELESPSVPWSNVMAERRFPGLSVLNHAIVLELVDDLREERRVATRRDRLRWDLLIHVHRAVDLQLVGLQLEAGIRHLMTREPRVREVVHERHAVSLGHAEVV